MSLIKQPFGFGAGGATDEYWSDVVLLANCDGADGSTTFTDLSDSEHTLTAIGNTEVDTAQKAFGTGSAFMDGGAASSAIGGIDDADFDFGSGDFTLEVAARIQTINGENTFFGKADGAGGTREWLFQINTSGKLLFQYYVSGWTTKSVDWSPSLDTWYFVAVSRIGNDLRFFIDGTQQGATQDVTDADIDAMGSPFFIGSYGNVATPAAAWNGWLDDPRITKGTGRYSGNYDVPTAPWPTG